jgi:hypothetical protein
MDLLRQNRPHDLMVKAAERPNTLIPLSTTQATCQRMT